MNDAMMIDIALAAGHMVDSQAKDQAHVNSGVSAQVFTIAAQMGKGKRSGPGRLYPLWRKEEDNFLRENTGILSVEEISTALGRSETAVTLRRKRIGITGPARDERWLCSRDVAELMGVGCSKTVTSWINNGWLKGGLLPLDNGQYAVELHDLKRFVVRPDNWILFDPCNVADPKLHRLAMLAVDKWGDRWLTTGEAAEYIGDGCDHKHINMRIKRGTLSGVQKGLPGSSWYVRQSEIENLVVRLGKGNTGVEWSLGADGFKLLATAVGVPYIVLASLVGDGSRPQYRIDSLLESGEYKDVLLKNDIKGVLYDERKGLYSDWQLNRNRFPFLERAVSLFLDGRKLTEAQILMLCGVLNRWAGWHLPDHKLSKLNHKTRLPKLHKRYAKLLSLGIDPLRSADGRSEYRGYSSPGQKKKYRALTDAQVREARLRAANGEQISQIAIGLDVNYSALWAAVRGLTFGGINDPKPVLVGDEVPERTYRCENCGRKIPSGHGRTCRACAVYYHRHGKRRDPEKVGKRRHIVIAKEKLVELNKRYTAGENLRSLAKEVSVSGSTLRRRFEEAGLETASGVKEGKILTADIVRTCRHLTRKEGRSIASLARDYGIKYVTLYSAVVYKTWKNIGIED